VEPKSGDQPEVKANHLAVPQDVNLANGAPAFGGGYPPEGRHPVLSSSWDPEGLVKALQRRWLLSAILGLACGALAAAAGWFLLPPGKISARAILRVASLPEFNVFPSAESRGDFQNYQKTQIALVKDRGVLTAALANPDVARLDIVHRHDEQGDAIDWLEREVKVDFSLGPEILSISFSGDNPTELVKLVNAIKDAYLKEIVEKEQNKRGKKLEDLKRIAEKYDSILKEKRKLLRAVSDKQGATDQATLGMIRTLNEDYLVFTKKELVSVRYELKKLSAERELLTVSPKGAGTDVVIPEKVVNDYLKGDAAHNSLLLRKAKLETDILESIRLSAAGENSPQAQRYKKDLAATELLIESRRKEARPKLIKEYQAKLETDKDASRIAMQNKIALYTKLENELTKEVEKSEVKVDRIGKDTISIDTYRAELQEAEIRAKRVSDRVDALMVEQDVPHRISSLDNAYIVHPDDLKRKLVASGLSGIGTLGLVLLLIAWVEHRPRRVHSVQEVQELGMKLVGTVPALPSRRQFRLLNSNGDGDAHWHSILTESVDTARTMLLHLARSERTQVVMVTSATGGEGKTSLSSHLAASLARAGRKTLLLDCDLRNPALHRLFGTSRSPGLCEVLRHQTELSEVIWQTPAPGLWMIPAGQCDGQALQALAQDKFRKIAEFLRPGYDFIVVDSAPVLPVADSLLVGQCVDAVIFSVLNDVSRLPKVYAAHQLLEKLGIRLLGAVVSGTHVDTYAPEYQYVTQVED
jgi:capsular exopolysaccharide synthesis family protein